jgi:hypothetical protein
MGKLLNRANSVETIFNAFGDKVKQYLDYYKNNSKNSVISHIVQIL